MAGHNIESDTSIADSNIFVPPERALRKARDMLDRSATIDEHHQWLQGLKQEIENVSPPKRLRKILFPI